MRILDEARAGRPDKEDFLEQVEGNIWGGEKLAGVGGGEANVGYGEVGEIVSAKREIFGLRGWRSA